MKDILNDISIIVQGAVSTVTREVLESIKAVFPCGEIILSTWENTETRGLVFDKLVLSKDPGEQIADEQSLTLNNVNRQIVSTSAGIKLASKHFALKTRTDILIRSSDFLKFFGKFDNLKSFIFKNRILICNYYTRNPRIMGLCFHPSDWVMFGNTEDLSIYYENLPLQNIEEANWFSNHSKSRTLFTNYLSRFTPEQYIFIEFIKKFQPVNVMCYYDVNKVLIHLTEEMFAKCFVVLDYTKQLKIKFLKYNPNRYFEKFSLISHKHWLAIYERYCKKNISVRWVTYCLKSKLYFIAIILRKIFVNLLDTLKIKKAIKFFLGKFKE